MESIFLVQRLISNESLNQNYTLILLECEHNPKQMHIPLTTKLALLTILI